MNIKDIDRAELIEAFEFMDAYRQHSNPMGAGNDLRIEMAWGRSEPCVVIPAWMETYDGESSAADRVTKATGVSQ